MSTVPALKGYRVCTCDLCRQTSDKGQLVSNSTYWRHVENQQKLDDDAAEEEFDKEVGPVSSAHLNLSD